MQYTIDSKILDSWSPYSEDERVNDLCDSIKYYRNLKSLSAKKVSPNSYCFKAVYNESYYSVKRLKSVKSL